MPKPQVQFEWLFETLNKRVGAPYNVKLKDLFLIVPYEEEAEFEFELSTAFNSFGVSQGINLQQDYPNLYKILGHNRKDSLLRVFFVRYERFNKTALLWHKKHPYPKVSKTKTPMMMLAEKALKNIEYRTQFKSKKVSMN
jgi:hypothetical protein